MKRAYVKCSLFESVGYDLKKQVLEVQLKDPGKPVWRYRNIPMPVFRAMMWAASKGRYFVSKINGRYPRELVSG
ncbi:MAG TPA: KTSC domain-containing protein [Sphingobacteriaceae bacterium]